MFTCKACQSKEAHIATLQHQVATLEKLVLPQRPTQDISNEDQESNQLLNGADIVIPHDPISFEASQILSGEIGSDYEI